MSAVMSSVPTRCPQRYLKYPRIVVQAYGFMYLRRQINCILLRFRVSLMTNFPSPLNFERLLVDEHILHI